MTSWSRTAATVGGGTLWLASRPARAHVDYVTDGPGEALDALRFALSVLANPVNAALVVGSGLALVVVFTTYFRYGSTIPDIVVLREKLSGYDDLVPWMLRLSVGLPLVGAGFQGYLFAPTATFDPTTNPFLRVLFIALGFTILFGLATRIVSSIGLVTYLGALVVDPAVLLAMEYVVGFLALMVLGGGRPSADDMLQAVAASGGTYYGRVDPVHHLKTFLDERTAPFSQYVPTVLRVGMGVTFVYLGLVQKLADPGRALLVVERYSLDQVVPVDPGLWVLGAGLTEVAVGIALFVGFFTRGAAAASFVLFTATLFGLPDDPVLAHVTLFGMASAVFVLGAGPVAVDNLLGRPSDDDDPTATAVG